MSEPLTFVACMSPPGQGAIASLGIVGPGAWDAVSHIFRTGSNKTLPPIPESGRFWFGHAGAEIADEVVLAVERIEPTPLLYLHCHGGREVVSLLLESLQKQGAVLCSWQQFLTHTEADPIRPAAAIALTQAPTARTAAILLDQYQGALSVAFQRIEHADSKTALALLEDLARWTSLGRHLTTPWRVAVAGPPNVGKSSLVNALAGYQRSVIAPTPGTTRDVVTVQLAIDGWPIELADTAGLREASESLEAQGIEQARVAAEEADLCLWLLDASTTPIWPEKRTAKMLFVINKIDRDHAWDLETAPGALRVSALTGVGIVELCAAIAGALVPEVPAPGSAVPFNLELCELAETAIQEMRNVIRSGISEPEA